MMNIRQRAVNVSRVELLAALKSNLEIHRKEYAEALIDFKTRLVEDLTAGLDKVKNTEPENLSKFKISISFPQNHEKDFLELIDMLERSVDEHINLDSESFQAYFNNKWSWTDNFKVLTESYKVGGSMLR